MKQSFKLYRKYYCSGHCCTVLGVVIEKIAYKPFVMQGFSACRIDHSNRCQLSASELRINFIWCRYKVLYIGDHWSLQLSLQVETLQFLVNNCNCYQLYYYHAALMIFIKKSKSGQAMLAVSEDKDAAQLMGVNVNKQFLLHLRLVPDLQHCRCVTMFCLPNPDSLHRCDAWYQGVYVAAVFGGIGSVFLEH